jgi:hypothetical protein
MGSIIITSPDAGNCDASGCIVAGRTVSVDAAVCLRAGMACGADSMHAGAGTRVAAGALPSPARSRAAPLSARRVRTISAVDADGRRNERVDDAGTAAVCRMNAAELAEWRGSDTGLTGAARTSVIVVRPCADFNVVARATGILSAPIRRACCRGFELRRALILRP